MPLGELAGRLCLAKPTCAHILKTLCTLNYVEQVAPRKGYCLGPGLYALARGGGYRADLVAAAEPAMRALASGVRETVLLAVLRGRRRFTLAQFVGTQDVQVRAAPAVEANVYETATGRLLLACADRAAREAFIAEAGLPGAGWPEVAGPAQLDRALADIRRAGRVVHHTPTHVVGIAYALRHEARVVAALGLFLPEYRFEGEHREAVLAGMERAAADISSRLAAPVGATAAKGG